MVLDYSPLIIVVTPAKKNTNYLKKNKSKLLTTVTSKPARYANKLLEGAKKKNLEKQKHMTNTSDKNEENITEKEQLRISCEQCNFVTSKGTFLRMHVKKYHQGVSKYSNPEQASEKGTDNTFYCDQCIFRTNKNKLLSIHMQKHQNKSKSSQLNSIGKERQKEGRIQTNSGHVFVPHEADRISELNEQYFEKKC